MPYSSKNYEYGTDYGILPVPVRDGFNFNGWYTSEIDGNHISDYSEVLTQSNITFYAHWTSVTHTLSFDPDGGICSLTSKSIVQGNAFGELPIPTKDYYSFTGWVFMDNTPASESSIMGASDVTIKATWYENPTSDWVRMNEVPEGAKVFQYKWTYDETEKKESYDSSIDGWTQTGSEWRKSGEGSVYYAYFPSTFDTKEKYGNNDPVDMICQEAMDNLGIEKSQLGKELSLYATTDFGECFAEAISEHESSIDPRELSNEIYRLYKEKVEKEGLRL